MYSQKSGRGFTKWGRIALIMGLVGLLTAEVRAAEDLSGGTLQFNQLNYSVNEGTPSVTITVERIAGSAGTATVDFRTEAQNATANVDYVSTNGTLTFPPGVTKATFKVLILADTINEPSEAVTLILENAQGAVLGGQNNSTLTIVDNDPCAYALNPTARTHGPSASVSNITVNATEGCSWVASANVEWIGILAGQGAGHGEVQYSIDTNSATAARTGRITVAEKIFTLTQQGAPLPDIVPPVVTILRPLAGARLTNATQLEVSGRAVDVRGVAAVEYRIENLAGTNDYQLAEGTSNWTAQVMGLVVGTNTVRVRARDAAENLSAEVTRSFVVAAASPLTVQISGAGSVTPVLNGQTLEVGRTYSMTAMPRPRNFFVGWSGGIQSNTARLVFQMQSNLSVQANFVTNPFIAVKGSYNGLFQEPNVAVQSPERAGFFNATITEIGTFTAKLVLAGKPIPFTGKFDLDGAWTNTLQRPGLTPLNVSLLLDVETGSDRIIGTVDDGRDLGHHVTVNNLRAVLSADRAGRPDALSFNGRYTLVIPGAEPSESLSGLTPDGVSFGTVTVTAGTASFSGMLADGTPVTQKVPVSKNGVWPLYIPLYGGNGMVFSPVQFADQTGDDLSGELTWYKPALAAARYYSNQFVLNAMVTGSRYQLPTNATDQILNFPTGGFARFGGGDLSPSFTNNFILTNGTKVINLSSNRLVLTIVRPSGLFNGVVRDPNSSRTISFKGALHQKGEYGAGFFLGTNQSGRVDLQKAP